MKSNRWTWEILQSGLVSVRDWLQFSLLLVQFHCCSSGVGFMLSAPALSLVICGGRIVWVAVAICTFWFHRKCYCGCSWVSMCPCQCQCQCLCWVCEMIMLILMLIIILMLNLRGSLSVVLCIRSTYIWSTSYKHLNKLSLVCSQSNPRTHTALHILPLFWNSALHQPHIVNYLLQRLWRWHCVSHDYHEEKTKQNCECKCKVTINPITFII